MLRWQWDIFTEVNVLMHLLADASIAKLEYCRTLIFSPLRLTYSSCQAGSPFREPLIKFLTRHPSQTVELFMMEATLNDPQWSRMFMVRHWHPIVLSCVSCHNIKLSLFTQLLNKMLL